MNHQTLVILDYGSQYTQLIARRSRELGILSVILPFTASFDKISHHQPVGIVLSGGPNSVYETGAPTLDETILSLNVPVLGICYGMQLLAQTFGGRVEAGDAREYGEATLTLTYDSELLPKNADGSVIWMSHGDHVVELPEGFIQTASSDGIIGAIEDTTRKLYGLQFHPEVAHSKMGKELLKSFFDICGFHGDWTVDSVIEQQVAAIRQTVGSQKVICALSGGVDSSVAATLVDRAIGDQQVCIFVDTGLLRQNEYEEVLKLYESIGLNVTPVRAAELFYERLDGVADPEKKRKIIGNLFIELFEKEAAKVGGATFLVQGTLYPDVVESVSLSGAGVTIKSHHNVGGLPEKMNLKLIEPLNQLFKDEVRQLGATLGLPDPVVQRQPFPGPGLAIRILGAVTPERIDILRQADAIVCDEIERHEMRPEVWQFFAVLLPVSAVGVMGDKRSYEQVIAVRAVSTTDGMTADWSRLPYDLLAKISSKIVRGVRGVNRVVYDITSKPPGTIEWE